VAGESMQPDGMLALMKWDEETPYMYFFKHGLDEEKVVSIGLSLVIILGFIECMRCRLLLLMTLSVSLSVMQLYSALVSKNG